MSNSYFQFKQFRIEQARTAMKVSTDACIQGAWTPVENIRNALDIGCGTGLLSLMLAQRNHKIAVDAIELDENAYLDAVANVAESPWKNNINVVKGDVRHFATDKQYDLIICNPPFFQNSLLSVKEDRRTARHTVSLSFADLFIAIQQTIAPFGYASVMLPAAGHEIWEQLVFKNNWSISRKLLIKPRIDLAVNRIVSLCTPARNETVTEHLMIYDANAYTPEFTSLLSPYYLKL